MAHWFHRNVLKATNYHKFEVKLTEPTEATKKLCSDLKLSRSRLLDLIRDANNTSDTIETAFSAYLSLLYGLIWEIQPSTPQSEHVGRYDSSKLRNIFIFKWSHTLLGSLSHSCTDSVYEAANMSINIGIWFMKHAAMIAGKDDISMDEAKEVHGLMRRAAGIFTFVQIEFLPQLANPPVLGSDLDPRAYIYCGENLLSMDKCGEAIKALEESEKSLKQAKVLCQEYGKTHGPAPRVKPDQHGVFKRLAPLVKITLDKCNRENGFIYHHKVPGDVPTLETKATYGLVSPVNFTMPAPSPLWTVPMYRTFIGTAAPSDTREHDLPPVREEAVHQSIKEPKNESGCSLQ
ncbi:BRO1 domain-containing protein BROX-like isoform X2 [Athalia rosae]|uniref:BRO1 domain-containing protein BROX-like isoform X2 n=1 Tax=Athalia rosae TaxID=37344 RepID=UPI0020335A37|nr:BRO1 domain-containing protein BROX-like isoform X2 [Athalia rosae]